MRFSDFLEPGQAREMLDSLDGVTTRDLYFWDVDPDGKPALRRLVNHMLLYNSETGEPIVPATNRYAVLPHHEAFGRILDLVMGSLPEIPVPRVYVENLENTARLWLLFPCSADEEQVIGVRITNSYDMSVCLQGDLVIWMRTGDYPIVLSKMEGLDLPPLALPHRAAAFELLEERTAAFIRAALGGESWMRVEVLIDDAQRDAIRFKSEEEKMEVLRGVFGKKLSATLARRLPDETSRWDVYTIMARTAHVVEVTPLMRDIFRAKAEAFLRS